MMDMFIRLAATTIFFMIAAVGFSQVNELSTQIVIYEPLESKKSDMERFMEAVAYRESKGNHRVVNQLGMMGKYQFSKTTLRGLRRDITPTQFLGNPFIQDTVMVMYLKANNKLLNSIISKYDGKTFKGIRITRSGVLAAAHLGGPGSVISWFRNPDEAGLVDVNGTSIREYMVKFAGYPIERTLL